MTGPLPLAGLRVLVTRPAGQAEALCALLEDRGAEPVRLPLLAIEPARPTPALAQRFEDFRDADAWIFTSRNAVQAARRIDAGRWPSRLYAVGAATAAALGELGLQALTPAQEFSSEGLLLRPELQDLQGQRLLLVTGADGLGRLLPALEARGATVGCVEVYRRVALPHSPEQMTAALRGTRAAIVTSGEALQQLLRLTPDRALASLRELRLVLPSARVVELARDHGFAAPPLVPEQISDAACVRCLEQWWTSR